MIKNVIKLLKTQDFYGESEIIEIAKGRYKIPETWTEVVKNIKRQVRWRLRKVYITSIN